MSDVIPAPPGGEFDYLLGVTGRFVQNRTLSRPMTGTAANSEHSRHQLPFGAVFLEQVSESLNHPEMRVHATSFENERWTERLRRREELIARRSV